MQRITNVRLLDGYRLALVFDDGIAGEVDLSHLAGKGVFAAWNDPLAFRSVKIGPSGELKWGEEIDLCPDALYLRATGRKPETLFPQLDREASRA